MRGRPAELFVVMTVPRPLKHSGATVRIGLACNDLPRARGRDAGCALRANRPAAPVGGRTDSHDRMDHPISWTDGVNKASTRANRWSRPGRP